MRRLRVLPAPACACAFGLMLLAGCATVTGAGGEPRTAGASATQAGPHSTTSTTSTTASTRRVHNRLVLRATVTRWWLPAPVYRTVAVAQGREIYVFGGHDTAGATVDSVDALNLAVGRVTVAGTLRCRPIARLPAPVPT